MSTHPLCSQAASSFQSNVCGPAQTSRCPRHPGRPAGWQGSDGYQVHCSKPFSVFLNTFPIKVWCLPSGALVWADSSSIPGCWCKQLRSREKVSCGSQFKKVHENHKKLSQSWVLMVPKRVLKCIWKFSIYNRSISFRMPDECRNPSGRNSSGGVRIDEQQLKATDVSGFVWRHLGRGECKSPASHWGAGRLQALRTPIQITQVDRCASHESGRTHLFAKNVNSGQFSERWWTEISPPGRDHYFHTWRCQQLFEKTR